VARYTVVEGRSSNDPIAIIKVLLLVSLRLNLDRHILVSALLDLKQNFLMANFCVITDVRLGFLGWLIVPLFRLFLTLNLLGFLERLFHNFVFVLEHLQWL